MAALLTLDEAKDHLRITTHDQNADIQRKIEQASDIIMQRLKSRADPTWTAATVPLPVKTAILLMLAHLHVHRGDNMERDRSLWASIGEHLSMSRDPTVA